MKLGSGVAPVPQMLAEGIPVALGTDGAASNNNLDLLEEMRTAALLHKGVNMNPTLMPADDALRMAILNGAQALGFRDTGCLKVGNKADLILMDFRRAHLTPLWDTLSHIVYSSSAFDIKTMIVDGRLIMDKGRILLWMKRKSTLKSTGVSGVLKINEQQFCLSGVLYRSKKKTVPLT